jgi:molecular chaperone GrpE
MGNKSGNKGKQEKREELEKKVEALPPQKTEVELLKEQLDEQKNKYLRALADLENYKKRANLERDEFVRFANESIVKELLPAVDAFAKAIEYANKSNNEDLVKGIALVKKLIEDALKKFGVEEVVSLGKPYDPNFHEAILMKESDKQPGVVLEEVQRGYAMHGRLLRPAMVIVSKPHPAPI